MGTQGSSLRITQSQHLALTETMLRALEMLQLPVAELEETIQSELLANPLLERDDSGPETAFPQEAAEASHEFDNTPFDEPVGVAPAEREPSALDWTRTPRSDDEELPEAYDTIASTDSLGAFLEQELALQTSLSEREQTLILWLIGNLDDEGLFDESFEAVTGACPLKASAAEWEAALSCLQHFAPAGIGARNRTEMLTLQLDRAVCSSACCQTAKRMLSECSDLLFKRDFKAISRLLHCPASQCEQAFELIGTLDPHPASGFAFPEKEGFVIPEVLVTKSVSGLPRVALNPSCTPRLHLNQQYLDLLSSSALPAQALAVWKERAQNARSFIHAVEQRSVTLLSVARAIVQEQPEFFSQADGPIRPMILKDIAQSLGISVSTVSRITTGKYMQTPRGTFELKHFFSSSVAAAQDSGSVSSLTVRERIRSLVAGEDCAHPLSDSAIAQALAGEGMILARRTVAKYRELEGIAPKSQRKR